MFPIKKILFTLFAGFLIYQTYLLMDNLTGEFIAFGFVGAFFISFLISIYVTGIFAFPGFVFKTSSLLPESYYSIKRPAQLNSAYKWLGVKYFRILLMITFWGKKKNKLKYFNGRRSGIHNLIYQTKQSEFGHLGALIIILLLSFILLGKGYVMIFILTTIINLIGNLYPVILQRKHRLRIEKLISK